MNLIVIGAPGAGKGTQAKMLAEKMDIPHISTGEMFRKITKDDSRLGKQIKQHIDKGALVPDSLTIALVKERLDNGDCKDGFILDGFPRTINQAESLDALLEDINVKIDYALNIEVADSKITERLTGRRVCSECGKNYHIKYNPPKVKNICDECNSTIIQREDDKEATVKSRLETYHVQTEPLVDYYKDQNKLIVINGEGDINCVFNEILNVLDVDK